MTNCGDIAVIEKVCSKDIELLSVRMRPHYLLREFTQVIMFTAYIDELRKKIREGRNGYRRKMGNQLQ